MSPNSNSYSNSNSNSNSYRPNKPLGFYLQNRVLFCLQTRHFSSKTQLGFPPNPFSLFPQKMEQPPTPNAVSPTQSPPPSKKKEPQKRKLPTPQELVAHYESQGLENKEASMKVIEDLQIVLFRMVSSGKGKKDKFMAESSRKLDKVNTRLAILELKMDSKPGYGESLAIGVASGGILRGIGSVFPHVVGAIGQMFNAVRSSTKS